MQITSEEAEKFWSKIYRAQDHWWYQGEPNSAGYGQFWIPRLKRSYQAHRVAYLLYHGEIDNNLDVLHTCDIKMCMMKEHLYQGTDKDNSKDRESRNRHPHDPQWIRGTNNPGNFLTETEVLEIRASLAKGTLGVVLAEKYDVSPALISLIKNRRIWAHI